MTFSIAIGDTAPSDDGRQLQRVTFDFGDARERCLVPIGYWTIEDYVTQWRAGLKRVCHEHKTSMLVTSIYDHKEAVNVMAWILYPTDSDMIKVQQHMLLRNEVISETGSVNYESLPNRECQSEEGEVISEWASALVDVCNTLKNLPAPK